HSLGGQAIQAAAATYPTYYRSMALVGSWTTAPAAVSPALKNVAVITGRWEEFSPLMWEVADSTDINGSPRMKKLFGTTGEVQPGKLHGSIADGTARILYRPTTNHPGNTADPASVGHAVEWMDRTLDGGHKATGQVWWAKELGTLLAFIGGVLFLFPFGALLLRRRVFAPVVRDVPEAKGARSGAPWYVTALVSAAIPAVTFFWFQQKGAEWIKPSALFPQELTNGVMVWALLNGLISLVLLAAWHLLGNRRAGVRLRDYGLAWEDGFHLSRVGRAALLAVAVTGGLYGLLAASDWLFHTDFRFYVLQLHLMDGAHLRIFLSYLLPFTAFFLVLSAGLHSQLRAAGSRRRTRGEMVAAAVVLPVGIAVLILVDYLPLLLTGTKLAVPTQPLLIIIGYQFVPLLAVAGLVSTYFFHRTGTVYTGAFVSAIVITWSMTAGTATHVPIGQWDGVAQLARVLVPLVAGVALIAVPLLRRRSTARHAASGTPGTPGTLSEAGTTV
ncbi:MAG TPA: hypothetical protein VHJ17_17390, partial [Thermomonospora sp.]|nr:hypothetical protein [Thermomonospora sp.]